MKSFLVVYDRRSGDLEIREYADDAEEQALRDRFERELAERGRSDVEVVLFYSDSIETLKKTHSHYFWGSTRVA